MTADKKNKNVNNKKNNKEINNTMIPICSVTRIGTHAEKVWPMRRVWFTALSSERP